MDGGRGSVEFGMEVTRPSLGRWGEGGAPGGSSARIEGWGVEQCGELLSGAWISSEDRQEPLRLEEARSRPSRPSAPGRMLSCRLQPTRDRL